MENSEDKNDAILHKKLDTVLQALLSEYNQARQTALSREQLQSSVQNFTLVAVSVIITAIPTITEKHQYYVFLLCSIALTSIGLEYMSIVWSLYEIAEYERQVLPSTLQEILDSYNIVLPHQINTHKLRGSSLWQWQRWFADHFLGDWWTKIFRIFSKGMIQFYGLSSLGFIALFLNYRWYIEPSDIPWQEMILLVASIGYSLIYVILVLYVFRKILSFGKPLSK